MITTFSVGGFCNDMQPSLNSSSPTLRSRVVAIICRLSHIPVCLPVTPHTGTLRSTIRIASPTQVELLPPATPQAPWNDMADTRCHCCVPASRPAQATTMKMTRETEVERQRHLPASVNIPARCKNNKPKNYG